MANRYGMNALDIRAQYSTQQLIDALIDNRNVHIEELHRAVTVYNEKRCALYNTISRLSAELAFNYTKESHNELQLTFGQLAQLREPIDQTEMYDQYIELFQASTSTELTLTMSEANSIINDEWDWAVNARGIAASYTSVSKAY